MKDTATAIVLDLDSTLADTRHRRDLLPIVNPASTWEEYALACDGDSPIPETFALMNALWPLHQIHIISGRHEIALDKTVRWLAHCRGRYDFLQLCPGGGAGGWTANGLFKVGYILQLKDTGVRVLLHIEDYPDVAERIRVECEIPVLNARTASADDNVPEPGQ
jgi:hypothetical protein